MNWRIESTLETVGQTDPVVELGEHEPPDSTPDQAVVTYAKTAASTMAGKLAEDQDCHVEIQAHHSTDGKFRPAHVQITVSLLDPDTGNCVLCGHPPQR